MHVTQFHLTHGSAIVLSEDRKVATRTEQFCNGIAFTASPIKLNQKVCLELTAATEWSGAIRIGVTTHDPRTLSVRDLPRYVCPELTNKEGYWARALNEIYADTGSRITFYINNLGQLHFFVNNEHKGVLLNHLPLGRPMWALFDIYGNTIAAKFVPPDEAPVEILARGPDAMQAYHKACESGTQSVFRTRLMLVGRDRVGKTSLKRALIGQKHDAGEMSTDGIDLSASCSFNLRDRKAWKMALSKPDNESDDSRSIMTNASGTLETLEEEYHRAIATNIVQELLYNKRIEEKAQAEQREEQSKQKVSGSPRKAKPTSVPAKPPKAADTSSLTDRASVDLLSEVPESVVQLVEELLAAKDNGSSVAANQKKSDNGRNILLNIWDFAGQAAYYTTHQVFLSSRAVYVIVFDLSQDLEGHDKSQGQLSTTQEPEEVEMSNLDYMDYWMHSVHAHTAQNTRNSVDNTTLSPPIFIVGTHRNSLSQDENERKSLVEEKFTRIRQLISGMPYERHVITEFFAVENNLLDMEDPELGRLRRHVEELASKEPYMGEQIPIKWLKFEQSIASLVEDGSFFSSFEQIKEVGREVGVTTDSEFSTLLEFYHDLGVIVYYGGNRISDSVLQHTVILKPQWLIDMFKRVITCRDGEQQQWGTYRELWHRLESVGILEEQLIDHVWWDALNQKASLLGLMHKFDLIAERISPKNVNSRITEKLGRSYFVPTRLRRTPDVKKLYSASEKDVCFYLDFNGFFPDGLFHRILTRAIKWSQECGGHEPQLYYHKAKFFLDSEHDYIMEKSSLHLARLKVSVVRVVDLSETEDSSSESNDDRPLPPPKPTACAKVRNFLENTLSDLRELWMKRICYQTVVECYCDRSCSLHSQSQCGADYCLHFLNLDECLSNKIVCCEHRRIKTAMYRKWFPVSVPVVKTGPVLPESVVKEDVNVLYGNIEVTKGQDLPAWVKSTAKLLNGGSEGQDWTALGKKLGYKKNKMERLSDDLNPGLALITDWIITSGNTSLSVDMMISCLEQMHRDDIVEIIQKGQASEVDPPQVFISYQWDNQDEVKVLRDHLEKAGFTCWMDIGQMGGGDQLYARVDEGIRNCKIVIACVTPKYIVSHYCNRELSLCDLLRKPIIPVMYEKVSWPPPGGMALMFSQLLYINMKGVGGHGGSGIHADLESKYQEVIQRVSLHVPAKIQNTVVELSPRISKTHGQHQDVPSHSDNVPSPVLPSEPLVIPGYASDTPPERQWPRGSQEEQESPRNTAAVPSGSQNSRSPVEQVPVTKCAVCTIL